MDADNLVLNLTKREGKFLDTDDLESSGAQKEKGLFTEKNFTDLNQFVEKSEMNLFGKNDIEGTGCDIHFIGSFEKMNAVFIKDAWIN